MKKNIKVLHVISGLGQGGAERQLLELIKINSSHGVCVLKSGGELKKEIIKNRNPLWTIGINSFLGFFYSVFKLKKIIKIYQPDAIQAWMYHACFLIVVCSLISFKKIPIIWSIRCSNMNTSKYSFSLRIIIYLCKLFSILSNFIIFNSYKGKEFHAEIGFNNKNLLVINNGIDTDRFKANKKNRLAERKKLKIPINHFVLITAARVDPMKGYEVLFEAYSKIRALRKDVNLVIVGKDTNKIDIPQGVKALGAKENIERIYNIADIIISPSIFGEGFSNVLAEGMSSKLIPIATRVGDSELILGKTGLTVSCSNSNELKDAIMKIINLDKKKLDKLKAQARIRIIENFNINLMINSYKLVYERLLREI